MGPLLWFALLAACPRPLPDTREAPRAWTPPPAPADDAIYFIMVDRFADGDPSNNRDVDRSDPQAWHGGDLQGVLDRLGHLQDLGVKTVWLSPIFASRSDKFFEWGAFHGYWVEDLGRVDPRFGDRDLLARLSAALHSRGMRLYMDMVFNHVAMDGALTRQRPDWFHPALPIVDWNDPLQLVEREVHGLPDLAQEKEEVYQHLLTRSAEWIQTVHPDGFRIDAVRHMSTSFLSRFSADIHALAGPDFVILGEDFQGDPVGLARSFEEGGFDAMFDFPLHYAVTDVFCDGRPVGRLAAILSADGAYPHPERLVTFLDNHDLPRIRTRCRDDLERVQQALAFTVTSRGTPSFTWGTEAAMEGAREPANRADMVFDGELPLKEDMSRWLALRRAHPSLTRGRTRLLALDGDLLVYAREAEGEVAILGVNGDRVPRALPSVGQGPLVWADGQVHDAPPVVSPGGLGLYFRSSLPAAPGAASRRVRIRARGAPQVPGSRLVLVGTGVRLANWSPGQGLGPFEGAGPEVSLEMEYPSAQVMEYKLVLVGPDGAARWQEGDNRYVFVEPGDGPLDVVTSW